MSAVFFFSPAILTIDTEKQKKKTEMSESLFFKISLFVVEKQACLEDWEEDAAIGVGDGKTGAQILFIHTCFHESRDKGARQSRVLCSRRWKISPWPKRFAKGLESRSLFTEHVHHLRQVELLSIPVWMGTSAIPFDIEQNLSQPKNFLFTSN